MLRWSILKLMKEFIQDFISHLKWDEIVDFCDTVIHERYELLLIAAAIVFIMVVCLSTILERLHERGIVALVPIYRFTVLFSRVGLSPALSLLMLIPGVNIIMRVVFYIFLARKFDRSYVWVPFLVLVPIAALPIVAFGEGHCIRVKIPKRNGKPAKKESQKKVVKKPEPKPVKKVEKEQVFDKELAEFIKQDKPEVRPVQVEPVVQAPAEEPIPEPVKEIVVESISEPVSKPVSKPDIVRVKPTAKPAVKMRGKQMDVMRVKRPPKPAFKPTIKKDITVNHEPVVKKGPKTAYDKLLEKQRKAQRKREKYGNPRGTGGSLDMVRPKKKT